MVYTPITAVKLKLNLLLVSDIDYGVRKLDTLDKVSGSVREYGLWV